MPSVSALTSSNASLTDNSPPVLTEILQYWVHAITFGCICMPFLHSRAIWTGLQIFAFEKIELVFCYAQARVHHTSTILWRVTQSDTSLICDHWSTIDCPLRNARYQVQKLLKLKLVQLRATPCSILSLFRRHRKLFVYTSIRSSVIEYSYADDRWQTVDEISKWNG